MQLLDFQHKALTNITTSLTHNNSVLLQSATASGKTVIASAFIKQKVQTKKNILVLVPLQQLVVQFEETLRMFGINASVLHAEITTGSNGQKFTLDWNRRVQITMPETLLNTIAGGNELKHDASWKPDYIILDEAHKATSSQYQIIRDMYPDAKILGLTATPYREKNLEGEDLSVWYGDNLITTISVKELIQLKRLVQPLYKQLNENTSVVNTWKKFAKGKRTIVFSKDTQHSFALLEAFKEAKIPAEVVTAGSTVTTPHIQPVSHVKRQEMYKRFASGETLVLISVNALCEGFDVPAAEVCMLARTVGNHALYHQMLGRVLRAFVNKTSALILDFYGNIKAHGRIEDYEWSIETPRSVVNNLELDEKILIETFSKKSSIQYVCHNEDCLHVYDIKKFASCGACGTTHKIDLQGTYFEIIRKYAVIEDNKQLKVLASRYQAAEASHFAKPIFNRNFGHKAFCTETNQLLPEFKFLEALPKIKNGGDFLKIKLLDNNQISVMV